MRYRHFRALAACAATAAVLAGGVAAGAGTAAAAVDDTCRTADKVGTTTALRYAGRDRYTTAVCVSRGTWADAATADAKEPYLAKAVVLARGDDFPDALAGGPLAGHLGAPLLLTTPTALRTEVREEILRVLPSGGTVYLLGSTASLSAGVESAIKQLGYATKRLAGANRFETAIKIADELPDTSRFFVTTGMDFPDALAAGSLAAAINRQGDETWALMFTNDSVMPAATATFMRQRRTQFGAWTLATAGRAADTAAVNAFGAGSLTDRFVGRNRFETAALVAGQYVVDGALRGEGVGIANGMNFPDALAGTPTLAVYGEPLLLAQDTVLPAETRAFLERTAGKAPGMDGDPATANIDIFGSAAVVSDAVKNAAVQAFTP
ncbi:cell wall-binding repeat-containing protein [Actinokineospora fastidiosa]|uniref:Cell wall-binding repeat-containing protein n=1 Tax=Actinokineospora fastidiosa TaxID=1816 RepID=A0A918L7I7_9PSEU|nr:cell wall-binding repeat-containing protein [Actinokineospora fastidiosa]GGS17523.1 hypothetical protein GCM10010171_07440 [Actinokineospora fastidiosa]